MGRRKWNNGPNYNIHQGGSVGYNDQNMVPIVHGGVREYYIIGEHLGSESRSQEFKAGAGFIQYGYRENVAKYVCAFLNSQENGKLLLGVDDNGVVSGYSLSHQQEDKLRCDTDQAVKDIIPPIFPKDYKVRFVPVHNENNSRLGDLKVIEICVHGDSLAQNNVLYSNKKGTYQRMDGGVHELSAYEIQEWTQQRYKGEIDKYKKNEQNLQTDLQNRQSERRQLEEKLRQKDEELRRREVDIDKLENQLKQRELENNSLSAENQEVREKLNVLKAEHGNESPNQQVLERLDRLEENLSSKKQQKSKVCVIS